MPPEVVLKQRPGAYDYYNGKHLLIATDKPTTVINGPVYEDVDIRILEAPAKHYVYRKRPYTAYYKDKAVILPRVQARARSFRASASTEANYGISSRSSPGQAFT